MVESISEPSESVQNLTGPIKQCNGIQAAYNQCPPPQKDQVWYLISSKWWRSCIVDGIYTKSLDNSDIIDPDTKRLKPNLIEGPFEDYVLVNSDLWQRIRSEFEILPGSEIARKVIEESDSSTRVEVYPFEFQVRAWKMNGENNSEGWNLLTLSCKDTMFTVREAVFKRLRLPEGNILRWWRRPRESSDSDLFQLVDHESICHDEENRGDLMLDQINVATGDFIVVEYKEPNETWSNDLPEFAFPEPRKFYPGKIISVFMQKWMDGEIVQVDDREQKVLVQPIGLADNFCRFFSFQSAEIKEKDDTSDTKMKPPSSPDSSSSSGSFTRNKRFLEGELKTGTNGTIPVASRLRLRRGIKGLQNLGNTCFMASTLQCLNRTRPFSEYFISKQYCRDLNFTNPLGMKGQLAKEYAKLLHEIWFEPPDRPSGGSTSIAPFGIKKIIAAHAPMFSGFRQHDSQELLAFLLDGLHEDVNRVTDKPYTSAIESNGRDDEIVAEEAWSMHLARNRSIVVDLFQGQLKSTVVCPKCQRVSVTFDPMMYLSLPLTPLDVRSISVTIIYADITKKPSVKTFEVPKRGIIADMVGVVGQRTGIRQDHLIICEIYANDVHKIFSGSEKISSISSSDTIFAYEIQTVVASVPNLPLTWVKHAHVSLPNNGTMLPIHSSAYFAYPRPLVIPLGMLLSSVHALLLDIASSLCIPDSGKISADDIIVKIEPKTSSYNQQVLNSNDSSEWNFPQNVQCDIIVHWSAHAHATKFDTSQNHMLRSISWQRQNSSDVTLQDCIELFIAEEVLSKEETWYCSSCKEFQQATKKFDLWKLPKILIVHLKRFQYSSYSRSKLDNFVDYPIDGLDLTPFVKGPQRDCPVIYDLYAISNHYGGFGGGHYTAYGKVSEDQWYSFDDSSTHPISTDQIKTRAAYVLFYELRENSDSSA